MIFNPKAFFLESIKAITTNYFLVNRFSLFYFIHAFMRYWPPFVPQKRTVPLVASSASVQNPLPAQKLIRFEKEQGECFNLEGCKSPFYNLGKQTASVLATKVFAPKNQKP